MLSDENFLRYVRLIAKRVAFSCGVDVDELFQLSLIKLASKEQEYDPQKSHGASLQDYMYNLVPEVVRGKAGNMIGRKLRDRLKSGLELDFFEMLGVSHVIQHTDWLDQEVEKWIAEKKSEWRDALQILRGRGQSAWSRNNLRVVESCSQQAGLFGTLVDWEPCRSVVPMLTYGFEVPTEEIALLRGVELNSIHKSNSRFQQAVKERAIVEFANFAIH